MNSLDGQSDNATDMIPVSRKRLVEIVDAEAEIARLRGLVEAAEPYVRACISHPHIGGDGPRKWLLDRRRQSVA